MVIYTTPFSTKTRKNVMHFGDLKKNSKQVYENETAIVSMQTLTFCTNGDVMRITCSVYRYVCVSLQSDIASYWPGIHNTAFLIVERNGFDLFKNVSIFSALLLCKLPNISRFCLVFALLCYWCALYKFTVLVHYMYLIALTVLCKSHLLSLIYIGQATFQ